MKRVFQIALLLSVALVGMPSSNADDKKPQEIKGWGTVVDPAGDCKVAEKDGKLTITVPGTHHDLNPTSPYDNVLAPRVLQPVEGDFTAQVSVDVYRSPGNTANSKAGVTYVGGALLLWQDEKNFIGSSGPQEASALCTPTWKSFGMGRRWATGVHRWPWTSRLSSS